MVLEAKTITLTQMPSESFVLKEFPFRYQISEQIFIFEQGIIQNLNFHLGLRVYAQNAYEDQSY